MKGLVRSSQLYLKKNASTILTVVGGAGVVGTTVLGIKATPKALSLLDNAKQEKGEELTTMEKVQVAAPVYIPTAISGVATIACIFSANILNKRHQAALTSAYALLDNSYKEYRAKVSELYDESVDLKIRDEIAKDKYEEVEVKEDEQLFYDDFSNRYFLSTPAKVLEAEFKVNRDIQKRGWATLNNYYESLDIDDFDEDYGLGWSEGGNYDHYWQSEVDFNHRTVIRENGTQYTAIMMLQEPYPSYYEY